VIVIVILVNEISIMCMFCDQRSQDRL